jgi:iron complex transport system ATP-binding protein
VRTPSAERGVTLEARGVRFAYGDLEVLRGVDLAVGPGEVVGLVGPNGSGKTTLVTLLTGLVRPAAGEVIVAGRPAAALRPRELARLVAVVPQEPSFGFAFSALEVVLMGRHPHLSGVAFESKRDHELARAALERCGVAHLASRSIHALSTGERQRVVFARALAQEPRAVVLDEPASALDQRHQVALYDIVHDLAGGGVAVLTVLHDLNLAAEYCDRLYLVRDGRIEASGPTASVLTYPNLVRVFETEVYVDTNTVTGRTIVLPLSARHRR